MSTNVTRGYGLLEGFLAQQRARQADRLIPPACRAGRLLDVGCGAAAFFLRRTAFREKYGLDQAVNKAAPPASDPHLVLVHHDVEGEERLPFQSEFFDVVTMLAVFEHVAPRGLPRLLDEVHRVLKPGGLYVMTTPARWSAGLLRLMARLRLVSRVEIADHKAAYDHARIASIFAQTRFCAEKMRFGYFEGYLNLWATACR